MNLSTFIRFRINPDEHARFDRILAHLNATRPPGSREVNRSEMIRRAIGELDERLLREQSEHQQPQSV